MNRMFACELPWNLTFSYGRALQHPSITTWKGATANVSAGQAALLHRASMNGLATRGQYKRELEKQAA
jgi:fructose-bisphosphate aldolase class I